MTRNAGAIYCPEQEGGSRHLPAPGSHVCRREPLGCLMEKCFLPERGRSREPLLLSCCLLSTLQSSPLHQPPPPNLSPSSRSPAAHHERPSLDLLRGHLRAEGRQPAPRAPPRHPALTSTSSKRDLIFYKTRITCAISPVQ